MLQLAAEQKFVEALGITLGTDMRSVAETADDSQAGDGGGNSGGARSLPGIQYARVLSVEPRTRKQIEEAVEEYKRRRLRLDLPAPGEQQLK